MRLFPAPVLGLIASMALLTGLLAGTGTATAAPKAHHAGSAGASIAKNRVAPAGNPRHAGRRARRAHGRKGLGNAVGLVQRTARPSAASELLFDGSQISDFDLIQSAPGAIQEVADPTGSGQTTLAMTVSDRDVAPVTPTENPRAQALSPPLIEAGDEFWLQTKFMLPENLPAVKGWMSLVSIYGAPFEGSSPWQIEVADNEIHWERNETYGWDIPWRMPLVKGRWVSVLLHERFAHDGWVEMWIDGQQVDFFGSQPRLAMQTMDSSNDEGLNSAKIMQYRKEGMFSSASVYFGPLKLGTSRESVGG
jgi:hypothetical protein